MTAGPRYGQELVRLRAKAATKVARYSARGNTHSSGTAATSVDRYVVTPSSALDGSADSSSHHSRRWLLTGVASLASSATSWARAPRPLSSGAAEPPGARLRRAAPRGARLRRAAPRG